MKLAINGGKPIRSAEWPRWPQHGATERQNLLKVLESGKWGTLGPATMEFEEAWSRYLGVNHALAVSNGTVSLETILRALGIGPGDEVIIPPYTFVATATAVLMVGATPVFADVDPETNNMDPQAAEACISENTKAVLTVHMAGRPADMDALLSLAKKKKLALIEDAAQAHGSEWKGRKLGSLGVAGSFSFQLSKNLSSGEGGAITTNDENLAQRAWTIHHVGRKQNGLWYGHYELSSNYRITDFQSALLLAGLEKLDSQIDRREASAALLDRELSEIEGIRPFPRDERATRITHHLYQFQYDSTAFKGASKADFVKALEAEGIACHVGYTLIQKQPLFATDEVKRITGGVDYSAVDLPGADLSCQRTVWILQNVLLDNEDGIMDVVRAIRKISENPSELGY